HPCRSISERPALTVRARGAEITPPWCSSVVGDELVLRPQRPHPSDQVKALAIRRYKAPMEMMNLPRPEPGPSDLLVRVHAAGVNPLDTKIRDGVVKVLT